MHTAQIIGSFVALAPLGSADDQEVTPIEYRRRVVQAKNHLPPEHQELARYRDVAEQLENLIESGRVRVGLKGLALTPTGRSALEYVKSKLGEVL